MTKKPNNGTYRGEKLKKSNDPKPVKKGKNANESVLEGGKNTKSKQNAPKSKSIAGKNPKIAPKSSLGGTAAKNKPGAKPNAKRGQVSRNDLAAKTQSSKKDRFPHFRWYKKSNHPALIVGEQNNEKKQEEYRFRKVMHAEKDGRHLNEKIDPNPNPKENEPMYIAKRVRHDKKSKFSEKPLPWEYPDKGNKKK